jgi:hypothetical protein
VTYQLPPTEKVAPDWGPARAAKAETAERPKFPSTLRTPVIALASRVPEPVTEPVALKAKSPVVRLAAPPVPIVRFRMASAVVAVTTDPSEIVTS